MAISITTVLAGVDAPRAIVAGLSGLVLALSMGPRNERAIFIVPDLPTALAALTATPNPDYSIDFGDGGGFGNFGGVGPGGFGGLPGGGAPGGAGAPFGPNGLPFAPIAGFFPAAPFGPLNVGQVPGLGGGGNLPGGGVGVPAVPLPQPAPGGGTDPVDPVPNPNPNPNPTPPVIVPAVPEPTTWAMLISGFAMIGVALRRRRARVGSAVPRGGQAA